MKKQNVQLPVINYHVAGIDVGSKEHWVAIGQNSADVRVFGVYTKDMDEMVSFLRDSNITEVVMEATGTYWQTLYSHLERAGFKTILSTSRGIKNPAGKTDRLDCQWLQQLRTLDLLKPSFIPEKDVEKIRQYTRYRNKLMLESTACINTIQKILQQLNLRLDVVLSDVVGVSGLNIINAILAGERDGNVLASLAKGNLKRTKEEIASALIGNWKEELLYQLKDQMEIYNHLQKSMNNTELKAEEALLEAIAKMEISYEEVPLTKKKIQKGQYKINVSKLSYQYYGVDLMAIEGIGQNTIMTLISEVGHDICKKFPSAKSFTKWLRVAPNHKITGGKVINHRTPKSKNLLALALRNAANTIAQRKEGVLKTFFSRIAFKKGRAAAITATARKLGVIIWTMIKNQKNYVPMNELKYDLKVKANAIKNIKNALKRHKINIDDIIYKPNLNIS